MKDRGHKQFRLPPDTVVERGVALELEGGVRSVTFHVESATDRFMVYEERFDDGHLDLSCTCPAHHGCEHVAAVLVHLSRWMPTVEPGTVAFEDEAGDSAERISWTSEQGAVTSSFAISPAGTEPAGASLYEDPPRAYRVRETVESLMRILVTRGLIEGREELEALVHDLEQHLEGAVAMDVIRPCAQLRGLILSEASDPGHVALVVERIYGVLEVLDDFLDGPSVGKDLEASYLGRGWSFDESVRLEDVTLMELARSTARTPFGLRRNKAYHLDLDSGRVFVEHSHVGVEQSSRPSVGPFPRRIHAGLMMVMPGIEPSPIRLLQYVILPSPDENALLRMKKYSISTVREAYKLLGDTVSIAHAPYPSFVVFGPTRVVHESGRAVLVDPEGCVLDLAQRVDAPACEAVALMAQQGRIHCITGLMVWTGHEIALNPLSLLLENASGLSLVRLR